jgi:pimeloyl-ACP methyl ester carboxylesterase
MSLRSSGLRLLAGIPRLLSSNLNGNEVSEWICGETSMSNVWAIVAILYGPVILGVVVRLLWDRLGLLLKSKRQVEDIVTNAASETSAVVILVHGTFARDAQWTKSDSKLRRELRDLFGEHAAYYRHQWSGHNTFRARNEAAAALATELKRLGDSFPRARLFIIAHSHGGNVALKALTSEIIQSVGGVVCLATPVLTARKRQYPGTTGMMFNWMGVVPSLLVTIPLEEVIGKDYAAFLFFALCGVVCAAIKLARSRISKLDFTEHYDCIQSDKVLFMRAPGDEASLAIGTAHVLSLLVEKVAVAPVQAAERMFMLLEDFRIRLLSHKVRTFSALAALFALFVLGEATEEGADVFISRVIVLPIIVAFGALLLWGPFLVYLVICFYASLLFLPMVLVTGLAALAVGPELAMGAVMTYMTAEVCPPGRWTVIQIPADQSESYGLPRGEPTLQHSIIYESEHALRLMRGWLSERMSNPL